jgi:Na+/melibiose symporter-like transporter
MRWRDAMILRVAAVWTAFVWVTFIRNIAGDNHSTGFKVVHITLAVISIGFAVLIWRVAHRALHGSDERS